MASTNYVVWHQSDWGNWDSSGLPCVMTARQAEQQAQRLCREWNEPGIATEGRTDPADAPTQDMEEWAEEVPIEDVEAVADGEFEDISAPAAKILRSIIKQRREQDN